MARVRTVTGEIDASALGVTLFQMLTGKYPFQGDTPIRVMMAHASDPIPDVRELRPDLPPAITAVVKKAMAKRPEDRYATASDLADDLKRAVQGYPPAAEEQRTIGIGSASAQRPPTPPPSIPAGGYADMPSPTPQSSPTPYMSAPQPVSTTPPPVYSTPYPPAPPQKRGCSPILVIGAILGVVALICGGIVLVLVWGSTLPTVETPIPPLTDEKLTAVNLTVDNQSERPLCYLYISVEISDEWGDDQLDSDTSIDAGNAYTVEDIKPGTYDIRAEDCDGYVIADEYGLDMTTGDQTWVVPGNMASLVVINDGDFSLCELYVIEAGTSDTSWGDSWLDSDSPIEPGSQLTFANIPYGSYDLRAVTCDGESEAERLAQTLDGPMEWTLSDSD